MSNFCDFTFKNYKKNLLATKDKYKIVDFNIFKKTNWQSNFAILRHDIDISINNALKLAKLEYNCGVRSTYTVLLTGSFYNPFEKKNAEIIKEIKNLGHEIGLHFDTSIYNINSKADLREALKREIKLLNGLLSLKNYNIKMFSFHNTNKFTMSCEDISYCGLINAYAKIIKENVQYTSDSNGYWIHRSWKDLLLQDYKHIQILTHPEWWNQSQKSPAELVCHEINDKSSQIWKNYYTILKKGKRFNKTNLKIHDNGLENKLGSIGFNIIQLWLSGDKNSAYLKLLSLFSINLMKTLISILTLLFELTKTERKLIKNKLVFINYFNIIKFILSPDLNYLFNYDQNFYKDVIKIKKIILYRDGNLNSNKLNKYFNDLFIANVELLNLQKKINLTKIKSNFENKALLPNSIIDWFKDHKKELGINFEEIKDLI